MIGQTVSHYQILEKLGEGGMGVVWKALDTRLDRMVAIKMLKDDVAGRLEREARAVAALNHPNICQVYDVGPDYLVMELVEGGTLSAKLKARPMKFSEALRVAQEAAEGLRAAHEKDIVHRDVKSANILMTPSGQVKLTDFGLVFLRDATRLTRTGVAVGTAGYMSPEQARGEPVDRRSDIWALGVILYEMVTGQLPFAGDSDAAVVHAILNAEPEPVTALRSGLPIELDRIVGKALEKDPKSRYQHVEDLAVDLKALGRHASSGGRQAVPRGKERRHGWVGALGWAAALVLAGVCFWLYKRPSAPAASPIHSSLVAPGGDFWSRTNRGGLTMSRDGRSIVYSAERAGKTFLFLRRLDGGAPVLLAGTEGATQPSFSPDQEWIGFNADGKLKTIRVRDGIATTLANAPDMRGAAWAENEWVYFTPSGAFGMGLWRVPARGGPVEAVTKPVSARDETSHRWPQTIPGSQALLFTIWSASGFANARVAALDLQSGRYEELVRGATMGQYANGYLLYARGESLEAAPFDPLSLKVTGSPVTVAGNATEDGLTGYVPFAAIHDRLVYRDGQLGDPHLTILDARGRVESEIRLEGRIHSVAASAHGGRVAFSQRDQQTFDVWLWDPARKTVNRLTSHAASEIVPRFSVAGDAIVYSSNRDGSLNLYLAPAAQPDAAKRLTKSPNNQFATSWDPTGRKIVFDEFDPATNTDIWLLNLDGGTEAVPLVKTSAAESYGRISPNGKWLAFVSNESGRNEVYVQPLSEPQRRVQVSTGGGSQPVWRPAGSLTYAAPGRMMEVKWKGDGSSHAAPDVLFERATLSAVSPGQGAYDAIDNERVATLEVRGLEAAPPAILQLIVNWSAGFRRR